MKLQTLDTLNIPGIDLGFDPDGYEQFYPPLPQGPTDKRVECTPSSLEEAVKAESSKYPNDRLLLVLRGSRPFITYGNGGVISYKAFGRATNGEKMLRPVEVKKPDGTSILAEYDESGRITRFALFSPHDQSNPYRSQKYIYGEDGNYITIGDQEGLFE